MGGYVGAGVETGASSAVVWASGMDVSILSTTDTLGVVVAGVAECKGLGMWRGIGFAWVVVELVVEVFLDLVGCILEHTVGIGGVRVTAVMNPSTMLRVVVGAKEDLPIVNCLEGAEGVKVALDGLGYYDLIIVLILDGDGDVVCDLVPIGLNVVLQHFSVDVDTGVSGGLGDVAGKGVDDAFKWKDGEGISVTDRTLYDLCVCEEMF
jgi:hypothetical protein